ncbi:MMPL family transporter [Nocardioides acrostichi]|uniref:MMPL family transporter n=1 Tax=Nocardioides acrostichi TaxID=2784339 RepID=A0A930Y8P0_9ACTN|nr:MMPL family transporter [Nocardioides acrostichi]MBF4163312.1 MMPL family transporter [Nocardioides acrostichi]
MTTPPRWSTWTTRRRVAPLAALLPLVIGVLLILGLGTAEQPTSSTDSLPAGSGAAEAALLADRLPDDATSTAIVLWTAEQGNLDRAALRSVQQQAARLVDGGQAVPSADGTAALLPVELTPGSASEVAEAVRDLRERLDADAPDGVRAQVTGPAAVQADLAAVFEGADLTLLAATATVVALLLIITYRSPVLWLVPLLVVGVADRLAAVLATHVLTLTGTAFDESTTGILSVLVFGAGTDYALLLISRYRDELRAEPSRHVAMARALHRTSEAVLSSATTVVVGVLTLLLSLTPTTRGLGLASAVGIVVAAVMVLVALPPALVLCGRWVFWPRVPRVGSAATVETAAVWRRVGDAVARRPLGVAVVCLVVLTLASLPAVGLRTGLSPSDQFLDSPEAITAGDRLAESFPAGAAEPARVYSTQPAAQILALVRSSAAVDSAQVRARGDGVVQVDAVLDATPGTEAATRAVTQLRHDLEGQPDTYVSGSDAERLDETDAAARDRLLVLPLILVLVLVALALVLRSVLAPLILVATVVATYLAALGLSWLVFTHVLGFAAMDVSTPLISFLFLVALGVDYNIFLVTRAREEATEHGTRVGIGRALCATGGVITSAGILLAAVFATLGVLPLVVLAQIGIVIGIGVLLDTLLVRTVLVPALVLALGERFWWPRVVRHHPDGRHPDGRHRGATIGA